MTTGRMSVPRWSWSGRVSAEPMRKRPFRELAKQHPGKTLRVLDVATGSGDVPISLWNKATDARVTLHVDGCDISQTAVAAATQAAEQAGTLAEFFTHDALHDPLPTG